jgi:hypothetical protein
MKGTSNHKALSGQREDTVAQDTGSTPNGKARPIRVEDSPRHFPVASDPPVLPAMIPDEVLDYYGWLFCQGGFRHLDMTFEGFLTVVALVSPCARQKLVSERTSDAFRS